ncbi:MAG: hypothetical protein LBQ75_02570 [Zoogloeaceae bacterium]|jgi:hypothetical protein|nr:hypothetical protein [Zoogloeaceae bacterium]
MLPKKPIAIKELPPPTRILTASKARQGRKEKGWAWYAVLGVTLLFAAVATGEPASPNPKDDEAREKAWENENRRGKGGNVILRSGLWEIGLAVDAPDRGSCTQVSRQIEMEDDICTPTLSISRSIAPGAVKDGMLLVPVCVKGAVDPLQFWQEARGDSDCRFTFLSRVDNKIKYSQLCQEWTSPARFGITILSDTDVSFTLLKQPREDSRSGTYLVNVPKSARWRSPSCAEETKCKGIESCVSAATMNMRNECLKHMPKELQGGCAKLRTGVSQNAADMACKKSKDEDCVKGLSGMSQKDAQEICSARKNKKAEAACYK